MALNIFDLHCHSWFSDGTLSPTDVVNRAAKNGVRFLSITDHDTIEGLEEAEHAAHNANITLIPGIELSVTWNNTTLHVVGLNIDRTTTILKHATAKIAQIRFERAKAMALDLEKAGIPNAFEGAMRFARSEHLLTRTHFARFLVDKGLCANLSKVYKNYLKRGKPGYIKSTWLSLEDAIRIIKDSKGIAVLAHPGRYDLSSSARKKLLNEFAELGGGALEVTTSNHTPEQTAYFTENCLRLGLKASCGSDFHSPDESRIDLGGVIPFPSILTPVWAEWLPYFPSLSSTEYTAQC
ncbi:MAG: PHP domain-containing protein [Pseudomonadota bacterium]